MSFLFVSHSTADKADRIRPLVEVLVAEGEPVWIDRPTVGEGGLGLSPSYVEQNDVDYLLSGRSWSGGIRSALQASGAVIGCLSRSLLNDPVVLRDELVFAALSGKLVACIVDDLSYDELSRTENGLLDLRHCQAVRLDCDRLREALRERALGSVSVDDLRHDLAEEWRKVRHLIANADRIRPEPRPFRVGDIARAVPRLEQIPVGPILHVRFVPAEIIDAFSRSIRSQAAVDATLSQAERLVVAAFPPGYTRQQILLDRAQLPSLGTASSEGFWTSVFALAGKKARRTLAALLTSPSGRWAVGRAGAEAARDRFLSDLRRRDSYVA